MMINYTDLDTAPIYEHDAGNGRLFQFGKLLTPHPDYPAETHALWVKTPVKDVTFLLNSTDAGWLGLVAYILNGNNSVNERWIDLQLGKGFRINPVEQVQNPLHAGDLVEVRDNDSPEYARFQGIEGKIVDVFDTRLHPSIGNYMVSFDRDVQDNWFNKPVLLLFKHDDLILVARYQGYEDRK